MGSRVGARTPAKRRDEALVARAIASGNPADYDELIRRFQSDVRNWLRHLTGDPARADDLAQETFIRAWERLHTISDGKKFKAWVMKIAYNMFLQSSRRQGREARLADALAREQLAAESHVTPSSDAGVADLPRMLAALSENERVTLVLCYAYGMSHRETAELTDMPLGTVKSHLRRGAARIRERFDLGSRAHG